MGNEPTTMKEKLIMLTDRFNLNWKEQEEMVDYLLENGVVAPPVEIGQTVWYIKGGYYKSMHKKPCPIIVTEINKKVQYGKVKWGFIANGIRYRFSSIGKSVFLSEEDAKKIIERRCRHWLINL